jgi:hypothetical protein
LKIEAIQLFGQKKAADRIRSIRIKAETFQLICALSANPARKAADFVIKIRHETHFNNILTRFAEREDGFSNPADNITKKRKERGRS